MTARPGDADEELEALRARNHDDRGVDIGQIDAMLRLSPADRLAMLYETALSLSRLMPDADADPVL